MDWTICLWCPIFVKSPNLNDRTCEDFETSQSNYRLKQGRNCRGNGAT